MSERQCRRCFREGHCMRIRGIDQNHPSARRLLAMGFDKGCDVQVERISPFGDPCMVKLRGYNLAVRRRDFEALDVEDTEKTGV